MDFGLASQLVLVTGSTSGIGLAIAKGFAKTGAKVFVNGRSEKNVTAAISEIHAEVASASLIPLVADVTTAEGFQKVIGETEKHGDLEVLVNNVGIFAPKDFVDISDEEWQNYFDVNVMSGVRLSRHYLPKMLKRDSGRILFISSECGVRPIPHMTAYSFSKASQINIARGLAEITKGSNVTVNSVLPGPTMTEGVRTYLKGLADQKGMTPEEAERDYFVTVEPTSLVQRFLRPEEVANVTVFLGSRLSSGVNGHAQRVEGGIVRSI